MHPANNTAHPVTAGHSPAFRFSMITIMLLALFMLISCRPPAVLLQPVPANIERIEGHASLRITGEGGSARSRFTFLFQLPHQGRIEVSDALLGRTLYQIIVDKERAIFLLPSKRVYWEGNEEDIIDYFMGFQLNLDEMINLIRGKWEEKDVESKRGENHESWNLKRDENGRILEGTRGVLRFEVREFLSSSRIPRILLFQHPSSSGRLKILRIDFNSPVNKNKAFSLSFLAEYKQVSWEEIEKILTDEN
jgi:outer membrane biogenesis lipoprotein LolB